MGDDNQMKAYVLKNKDNVYNSAIDTVMQCLIDRNFVTSRTQKIGEAEMTSYLDTLFAREM
jgi:hypothetical protein